MVSKEGMGEVVRLPLRLRAVFGDFGRNRHYPSIVNESVKLLFFSNEFLCC